MAPATPRKKRKAKEDGEDTEVEPEEPPTVARSARRTKEVQTAGEEPPRDLLELPPPAAVPPKKARVKRDAGLLSDQKTLNLKAAMASGSSVAAAAAAEDPDDSQAVNGAMETAESQVVATAQVAATPKEDDAAIDVDAAQNDDSKMLVEAIGYGFSEEAADGAKAEVTADMLSEELFSEEAAAADMLSEELFGEEAAADKTELAGACRGMLFEERFSEAPAPAVEGHRVLFRRDSAPSSAFDELSDEEDRSPSETNAPSTGDGNFAENIR